MIAQANGYARKNDKIVNKIRIFAFRLPFQNPLSGPPKSKKQAPASCGSLPLIIHYLPRNSLVTSTMWSAHRPKAFSTS